MFTQEAQDDIFIISLSTALGMGQHLLILLNTVIQNLPESELRRVHDTMGQSVTLANKLLEKMSLSSTFNTLTVDDGTCISPSVLDLFSYFLPPKSPLPSVTAVPSAPLQFLRLLVGLPLLPL